MEIKNDMEHLVKAEVRLQRDRPAKGIDGCWCSLCEADVHALALNKLPPRYCHQRNFGFAAAQGHGDEVKEAVALAIEKVSRRPRHRPGRPLSRYEDIQVDNYAQKIGHGLVGSFLTRKPAACACDQCRADTLAYALNRYPPKYGVSYAGQASYQTHYEDFIRHEVGQALAAAMSVVQAHPHH
jgi:competence protein ComFB